MGFVCWLLLSSGSRGKMWTELSRYNIIVHSTPDSVIYLFLTDLDRGACVHHGVLLVLHHRPADGDSGPGACHGRRTERDHCRAPQHTHRGQLWDGEQIKSYPYNVLTVKNLSTNGIWFAWRLVCCSTFSDGAGGNTMTTNMESGTSLSQDQVNTNK